MLSCARFRFSALNSNGIWGAWVRSGTGCGDGNNLWVVVWSVAVLEKEMRSSFAEGRKRTGTTNRASERAEEVDENDLFA